MHQDFLPAQASVLDYLAQPVFYVKEEQIIYRNRAAAILTPADEDSAADLLLPEDLESYRGWSGSPMELVLRLSGNSYNATVHREEGCDVFVAQAKPMYESLSLDTMAVVGQTVRSTLSDLFDASSVLFPLLEEQEDPQIQKQTARLNRGFYQLLRLAANLADASRFINGETRVLLERTEITEFFGQICDQTESLCQTRDVELVYQFHSKPFYAAIDWQKLERAALNLIANALAHTAPGGQIVLRLEDFGHSFHLHVSDNGEGMDPRLLSSIFSRYEHRSQPGDPRCGVGLGLPLVRFISNLHGGTVILNSAPGGGTTVTMSISRRLPPSPKAEVESPVLNYDYAGGYDHMVLELSSALPDDVFDTLNLD